MDGLEQELKQYVKGEVRFDKFSRILYSTDASIYEIEPIGVVIPKGEEDVAAVLRIAREDGTPILPRGGGTSLAGQAVGRAVMVDMSKFMNQVLEVNPEERWVRVQPGIVLDELNAQLRPSGLFFAPDVAPSNRATIGGMAGNNSCGARSIIYGKTIDHVKELRVLLADSEEVICKPLTREAFEAKGKQRTLEGQIYREVQRIVEANRDEILKRYPKIMRRVGGYNLDEFVKNGDFNLAKLMVGSEGTLATILEAKLNLVPRPKMTALCIVHFREFLEAMEATNEILPCGPSAVELIDKMIIDLTKGTMEYARRMTFVQGNPEALLLVEFYGTSFEELRAKVEAMEERLRRKGFGYAFVRVFDPEEQANVWKVRKAGLGLLQGIKGDRKPIAFVEDTAVAPEHLPQYIRRFRQILKEHGTTAGYYGHTSVGCLHIRPMINLKDVKEIEKMRAIAEAISDLVLEYGGAMSAEHGDGLARSQWNEKMFGPVLYQAFKEVKRAFDPQGIMNPGKIVDAPPMTENLRYGANY
ncbi:MAG: FAD-binding oxidoreductase, partial [candidate division NC10 bacterium]|nr:FAD-binding oxidoreductase [candidate division NC10 bacterium]